MPRKNNLSDKINQKNILALQKVREQIDTQSDFVDVSASFFLTKGEPGYARGVWLRDKSLEEEVSEWLSLRVSFEEAMKRYQHYDPNLKVLEWPKHVATHLIEASGVLSDHKNIFMFFPEVLKVNTEDPDNFFGFEFVDVWVSVFDEIIIPCLRRTFSLEVVKKLYAIIRPNLGKIIYLAAVFHEIGHRVSCWKISPKKDKRVQVSTFHTDILGELSTDVLLINLLVEFPEVKYFIFLQRLFWFGRRGFSYDQYRGQINLDNDAWIGSFLWKKYQESGCIKQLPSGRWDIDFNKLDIVYKDILLEIDLLGKEVCSMFEALQDDYIHQWMKQYVPFEDKLFRYPDGLDVLFRECLDIPEFPSKKF